jgi:hypothetical protein
VAAAQPQRSARRQAHMADLRRVMAGSRREAEQRGRCDGMLQASASPLSGGAFGANAESVHPPHNTVDKEREPVYPSRRGSRKGGLSRFFVFDWLDHCKMDLTTISSTKGLDQCCRFFARAAFGTGKLWVLWVIGWQHALPAGSAYRPAGPKTTCRPTTASAATVKTSWRASNERRPGR